MPRDIKRGDREPRFEMDISSPGSNLGLVVGWKLMFKRGSTVTNYVPTVTVDAADSSKAVVSHTWAAADTNTVGVTYVEVEATWPGGGVQTFPTKDTDYFRILPDLG